MNLTGCLALALLTVASCRPTASAPDTRPVVAGLPPEPTAITASDGASEPAGRFVPPQLVEKVVPDWHQFPSNHLPGKGGAYRLWIDEVGRVTDVGVVRPGHPTVDKLVLEALRKWRFQPATLDGEPVAWNYKMTLSINLQ